MTTRHLVLGGARSGKSRFAEQCAAESGLEVVYVATATAGDAEMTSRIAHHQAQRPAHWALREEPLALGALLKREGADDRCLLIDCLTLWLSNLLAEDEAVFRRERHALLAALPETPGQVILVSNEVGWGIVPANALARQFRDEAGRLHQAVAERCERATLVVAGLPMKLK